jgi:predicted nucleic acid-binding protein
LVILDADIASTLAKVDKINLIERLFGPKIFISGAVYKELLIIKQAGYDFPIRVFQKARVLSLNSEEEFRDFEQFIENRQIHYGEAESMSLAKNRNYVFLTNDTVALKYAQSKDIKVLNLKDILVRIAASSLLSREEMENLIRDIKEKDNTYIKWEEEIFDLYQPTNETKQTK